MKAVAKTVDPADREARFDHIRPAYLEALTLVERLHRRLLDVIKDEFDRRSRADINSVQALLLYNIGEKELTAGELRTRGYYLGSNVSYNLKKLVEMGFLDHQRSRVDRRSVRIKLTDRGREVRDRRTGRRHQRRRVRQPQQVAASARTVLDRSDSLQALIARGTAQGARIASTRTSQGRLAPAQRRGELHLAHGSLYCARMPIHAGSDVSSTAQGAIDCDVHPQVVGLKPLLPYLEEHWRNSVVERGIESLEINAYPPNAPITSRPEWGDKNGRAATNVTQLREQIFDRWQARFAICNPLYGVELLYSEDMAAAFARALNDWVAKEWLSQVLYIQASAE